MNAIQKIKISPESTNYDDNVDNVAYLYRGYIIWKETHIYVGDRGGHRDDWNFGPAVLHTPDAELDETFEPYWDDNGDVETCESRRDCVARIDKRLNETRDAISAWEAPQASVVEVDEDEQPVTITITKAQARLVLAALSERHDTVQKLYDFESQQGQLSGAVRSEALVRDTKATYQSIDKQVYGDA